MKRSRRIGVAAIGIPALVTALGASAFAAPGSVKVGESGAAGPANDPHVSCPFDVLTYGGADTPTFELVAPTPGSPLQVTATPDGWRVVMPNDVVAQPQQGYHVRVTVDGKSKVIWTGSCAAQPGGDQPGDGLPPGGVVGNT